MSSNIIAIVDIDTTIANNDHRSHFLLKECDKCETEFSARALIKTCHYCGGNVRTQQGAWDRFLDEGLMAKDDPQEHAREVLNYMRSHGYKIVFLTGRNNKHRDITKMWLIEHMDFDPEKETLLMRPKEFASIPASQLKEQVFLEYERALYESDYVERKYLFFEDDPHVLKVWKKYGLVFKCPEAWATMNPVPPEESENAWSK